MSKRKNQTSRASQWKDIGAPVILPKWSKLSLIKPLDPDAGSRAKEQVEVPHEYASSLIPRL